jgi:hypothetical protein
MQARYIAAPSYARQLRSDREAEALALDSAMSLGLAPSSPASGGARRSRLTAVGPIAFLALVSACATLQQIAALRDVDFAVDRLSDVRLADVDLARVTSYSQLSLTDARRLAAAVSQWTSACTSSRSTRWTTRSTRAW